VEIFPAIDIRGGQVVRASRTDPAAAVVYNPDPYRVADGYAAAGARWVHVVDLDRAFGVGDQSALVAGLVKRLAIPVQLGGGLWRVADVMAMRDCGVQRVVLGVRALGDEPALRELVDCFSDDCLALAIDARNGMGWARDWPEAASRTAAELVGRAGDLGVHTVVYTDLAREGALLGPNVAAATAIAREADAQVIVSGGVTTLRDLAEIKGAGLAGAVVGRALSEQRFTLEEALACCSSS
jgi:phosphoribosylformimino-5-aminoimidazole carboxamide ribotide isomerase